MHAQGFVNTLLLVVVKSMVPGIRITSGLMALIGFGLPLLISLDLTTRSPGYRVMSEMAPAWVWGSVWVIVGAGQIFGAFGRGYRRLADVISATLWFFWAYTVTLSVGLTTVLPTYAVLACLVLAASVLDRRVR